METMRKINNLKEALKFFEDAAIKYGEAIRNGKSKIANRNFDILADIAKYLRKNNSLYELSIFYTHPDISLRSWAATYLLPVYEKESIKVLKEIAKMDGIESFNAEMTIKEWKNGNLRNYYTL